MAKRPDAADITLTSGPGGSRLQFVEVPKDPGKTAESRISVWRNSACIPRREIVEINRPSQPLVT